MTSQDFETAVDVKAREMLAEELRTLGIHEAIMIWPETNHAYVDTLDRDDTEIYQKLAQRFHVAFDGEDKAAVDEALFERYQKLLEADAPQAIKQETLEVTVLSEQKPQGWPGPQSWGSGVDGTEMVTWQGKDGWYGCLQGQDQGNWFESEDHGPFDSREEAEEELRDLYNEDTAEINAALEVEEARVQYHRQLDDEETQFYSQYEQDQA